jgi:type IV pilus assembly protein PilV
MKTTDCTVPVVSTITSGDHANGFSLIELLIALTIFAVGILAVAAMQTVALRGGAQSTALTQAVRDIAQDKIEELLSLTNTDSNLTAGDHPSSSTYEEVAQNGVTYKTRWTVTDSTPNPDAKTVLVTTTWTDLSGSHTVNATFVKDDTL